MYCPKCGQRLPGDELSCPNCEPSIANSPPALSGQECDVLRYSGMKIRAKCDFPGPILNWLADDFAVLSYPKHLILVKDLRGSDSVGVSTSILATAAAASLGGSLLLGAPLTLLDTAIGHIKRGKWDFDRQAALKKYSDCQLLWCEKNGASFTCFDFRKMAWLIPRPSAIFLEGKFHSALGPVKLSICFFDPSQYRAPGLSADEINAFGLPFSTLASQMSDNAYEAMRDQRYKGWEFLTSKQLLAFAKQFVKS